MVTLTHILICQVHFEFTAYNVSRCQKGFGDRAAIASRDLMVHGECCFSLKV